jgi:hypothetical protein
MLPELHKTAQFRCRTLYLKLRRLWLEAGPVKFSKAGLLICGYLGKTDLSSTKPLLASFVLIF